MHASAQGLRRSANATTHSAILRAVLLALLVFAFAIPNKANAQIELSSVSTDTTYGGLNISYGVPRYSDSLFTFNTWDLGGDSELTLISTSTTYTILSITYAYFNGAPSGTLKCGSVELYTPINAIPSGSFTANHEIHCTGNLLYWDSSAGSGHIYVQYVPYDTRTKPKEINDIVFGIGLVIFILATIFGTFMISIFKKW